MSVVVEFPEENWRDLLLSPKGPTARSIHDAVIMLQHHPKMAGLLRYDAFSKRAVAIDQLPWHPRGYNYPRQIDDADGTMATSWLEAQDLHRIGTGTVKDCLLTVAKTRTFNPLIDWLQGLEWDGTERIEKWLSYYLGAELTDYTRAVGPKFLIGAVARALKPGSKVDTMLILEGPQGRFKSTAARTLFGVDWYTDDLADLHSKDAALQMQGKWGIEISELGAMSRAETNRIKAVLSRQVDRFRAPYDRFVAEHPRQCVFIGTTNPVDGYLRDPTGARRFWPVTCGTIDKDALYVDRGLLWAEAVHCFERGDPWWLEGEQVEAAKTEQDDRREVDPWEAIIREKLGNQKWARVNTVLISWLDVKKDRVDKAQQMRVAAIFRSMGWERMLKKFNGIPERIWIDPARVTTPDQVVTEEDTLL